MKPSDKLLPRLQRVSEIGPGRHRGSCPTSIHTNGDRSQGLRVTELQDGCLLVHCYAGCPVADVVEAVGLSLSDLFPDKPDQGNHSHRMVPRDALKACYHEIMVISVGVGRLSRLTPDEVVRVQQAGRTVEQILRRSL